MKRTLGILAVVAAALVLPARAQQPQVVGAKGAADVTTITAKIEAIDLANRVVTIKGPLGRTVALEVDDRVKNLPQVKVGDEIVLKYTEAVLVAVVKGGGGRSETTTAPPARAPAGAKPGTAVARQTKIVARVDQVDPHGLVVLERPNSRYVEVRVRAPSVLKELKVGDNVEVTYTEALVVDVVTPKP